MNTATITISGVETKHGTSKTGKPWTLYKIQDQSGTSYSTFDAGMGAQASQSVGQVAQITYTTNEKGYHDLDQLNITGATPAPQAAPAAKADGTTDWDLIGLRKTRCALWVAAIGAGHTQTESRSLVMAAEADIFHRTPAQNVEDDIPF